MPRKLEDLTGKRFGKLIVESHAGKIPHGKYRKQSAWRCVCDCGNQIVVGNNNLKRNNTQSCGCLQKERAKNANLADICNHRFGMLVSIEYVETRNRNAYWRCVCDCGNSTVTSACSLKSGQTKSCGCRRGNYIHGEWSKGAANYSKFRRKNPLVRLRHNVSSSIRTALRSAKGGKRTFNHLPYTPQELKTHLERLFEPWMSWENYGGKSNDNKRTWHIDHIIPHCEFPYTSLEDQLFVECWSLNNLRPLEKKENFSKGKSHSG